MSNMLILPPAAAQLVQCSQCTQGARVMPGWYRPGPQQECIAESLYMISTRMLSCVIGQIVTLITVGSLTVERLPTTTASVGHQLVVLALIPVRLVGRQQYSGARRGALAVLTAHRANPRGAE